MQQQALMAFKKTKSIGCHSSICCGWISLLSHIKVVLFKGHYLKFLSHVHSDVQDIKMLSLLLNGVFSLNSENCYFVALNQVNYEKWRLFLWYYTNWVWIYLIFACCIVNFTVVILVDTLCGTRTKTTNTEFLLLAMN